MEIKTTKEILDFKTRIEVERSLDIDNERWVCVEDLERWIAEYNPNNRSRKNVLKDLLKELK